jgi:hypothetical protein
VLDILKLLGAPGSILFLILALLAGLALVRWVPRFRRVGLAWLIAISASYIVLALPIVANTIVAALPTADSGVKTPISTSADSSPPHDRISTLIVLDGDNRRGRVREVQRVLTADPQATVWVLGGRWILEALEEARVSGARFRYDATAGTTREQMDQVARVAADATDGRISVIASRLQAPRVAALARTRGIHIRVLPAEIDTEPPIAGFVVYVPSYVALRVSRDALYEHAALAYYRWRGWIA